jgi:pyruvate dehydrogenase E1 component alpha subunit
MPPIKRTKFNLSPDELLEMLYWLKLIRSFDERLSILVRQGKVRSGAGATLIECKTYRWHGHSEHDKAFYRTEEELAMWRSRDPIPTFTTFLQDRNVLTPEKLQEIEARVKQMVDDAVAFAESSPDPDPAEAVTDLCA